jgi:hypothetical protein
LDERGFEDYNVDAGVCSIHNDERSSGIISIVEYSSMETWRFDDYSIWIPQVINDAEDDNIDIYVTLKSGERYGATLFTLKNIHTLMEQDFREGDNNDGQFFRCPDPVIVMDLTEKNILDLVAYLFKNDELKRTFKLYKDAQKPNLSELIDRLYKDEEQYGGTMPREAVIAWRSYLAALREYDALPEDHIERLEARLPPLEDPSVLNIFLNPPPPEEDEDL